MPPQLCGLLGGSMFCNIGFKTDMSIGKSAIKFDKIKKIKFDTPSIAIVENGNISSIIQSLSLNKLNIPAVELYVVQNYNEKRAPIYRARFFAFDKEAYKSLCLIISIANQHKHYAPRIVIEDLILNGDIRIIVDADFLFLENLPKDKTYVAINADSDISDPVYLKYNPIFYYDSYALEEKDLIIPSLLSGREFKHRNRVWYYDELHYHTAQFIPESIQNYLNFVNTIKEQFVTFENKYAIYNDNPSDYFDVLVEIGFRRKCPQTQEYIDRLQYEKDIIKKLGYENYFLINWDFINWARNHNIPIGPGRGSAAGSIIAYCLDITKLDPIKNGLYFERFLNPERVSPPDIDTDINDVDRILVIDYIKQKYHEDYVSQIITFSQLKSASALKDAARLNQIDAEEVNNLTKLFPASKFGVPPTLDEAYEVTAVKEWAEKHTTVWEEAKYLEGFIRQTGLHAAGLIISPTPLKELTGVTYIDNSPVCQLNMGDAEKFGLLKMDFLGLSTLGIIKNTLKQLNKSYYELESLSLDDIKIFEAFAAGDTYGIFQFESDGMRQLLKRVCPTRFADLAACNALYRPGPLMSGLVDQYVRNKHSVNPEYSLPEFKELLAETYGIFVYQEQVMLVAQKIAGFSLPKADTLRKAIGKKNKDLMETLSIEFITGSISNGCNANKAEELWTQIVKFADYCFNKSHSYAYALLAYWTMYLKVYHPKEFAVALLSSNMKDTSKLRSLFYNFKDKVNFLPPHINKAGQDFMVYNNNILMGLGSIKGLGNSAFALEKNKPYTNIANVLEKVKLDKTQLTALIYCGAFDELESNRGVLLGNLERLTKFSKRSENSEVFSLFDASDLFSLDYAKCVKLPSETYIEMFCYGFNIKHGFINDNKWMIESLASNITIGLITEIKRTKTKARQQDMAILTVETVNDQIKVVIFPEIYTKHGHKLVKDSTYAFLGYRKENEENPSLIVNELVSESEIGITIAKLYIKSKEYVESINQIINFHHSSNAICSIRLLERTIDDDSTVVKVYDRPVCYNNWLHDKLRPFCSNIELNVF